MLIKIQTSYVEFIAKFKYQLHAERQSILKNATTDLSLPYDLLFTKT